MTQAPDIRAGGLREALEAAHTEIVLTIAFLGRDLGTSREAATIDGLMKGLSKADAVARAALAAPAPAGREEIPSEMRDLIWNVVYADRATEAADRKNYSDENEGRIAAWNALETAILAFAGPTFSPQDGQGATDKLSEMLLEDEVVTLSDNEAVCIDFGHISDFTMTLGDLRKVAWKFAPPAAGDRAAVIEECAQKIHELIGEAGAFLIEQIRALAFPRADEKGAP